MKTVGEEGLRLVAVVTVRPEGEYHQDKKKCELYFGKEPHMSLMITINNLKIRLVKLLFVTLSSTLTDVLG